MEWKKAKNLVLIVLLCVNLFLGGNIYFQMRQMSVDRTDKLQLAMSIVENQGYNLPKEDILSLPQTFYQYKVTRNPKWEERVAEKLIGNTKRVSPGGGIEEYRSDKGNVIFRKDGSFSCVLFGVDGGANLERSAAAGLEKMGASPNKMESWTEDDKTAMGGKAIKFQYKIGGKYKVESYTITARQTTKGIEFKGQFLNLAKLERVEVDVDTTQVVMLLSKVLNQGVGISTIEGIELMYTTGTNSDQVVLAPILVASTSSGAVHINLETMAII